VNSVYELPLLFEREGFGEAVCKKLGMRRDPRSDFVRLETLIAVPRRTRKIPVALSVNM
jgi:CTP synthase (UTP-ammonia lyase)